MKFTEKSDHSAELDLLRGSDPTNKFVRRSKNIGERIFEKRKKTYEDEHDWFIEN